jgi:hypothetical protein
VDELLELKRAVSELGSHLTRDLHRMVHAVEQDGPAAAAEQPDLQTAIQLCQVLRSDTKALIRANANVRTAPSFPTTPIPERCRLTV